MFMIKISYITGDSFHSEDTVDFLPGSWKDIEIVKENINRIEEHYKWFKYITGYNYNNDDKKKIVPSFIVKNDKDPNYINYSIKLLTDDKNEFLISPFWCGYFEQLQSIEIVLDSSYKKYFI